jgi:NAD(P)-dependent dehydrogenase (short-subunit alcohol dehydrogenase family)
MNQSKETTTAVVTGAGSGVGRAVAIRLASHDWNVALLGRRESLLRETAAANPSRMFAFACDIADPSSVETTFVRVHEKLGFISVLVNSAGTNAPRRSLEVLSLEDYQSIINTNLNGAFYCVQAVLPDMRKHATGTIVNIVSDAGLIANAKAGPAYVASKFGLTGLTQSINAEERDRGIRACAISPGEINTPILDKRPAPPPTAAREKMLQPEDIADCVMLAITLPARAVVEQLVIRPR